MDHQEASEQIARDNLRKIFFETIEALDPYRLISAALQGNLPGSEHLPEIIARSPNKLRGLVVGKAGVKMALALSKLCHSRLIELLAIVPHESSQELIGKLDEIVLTDKRGHTVKYTVIESSHPLPSEASAKAAIEALRFVGSARHDEILIVCLSGGASAMMAAPLPGITLDDKIALTQMLLRSGASIHELNTVRKHISAVKGGRLLQKFTGLHAIVLAMSDVLDNDPATIGSGPFSADPTTYADARAVLEHYRLWEQTPSSIRKIIEAGLDGSVEETLKPNDPLLKRLSYVILADNMTAVTAARKAAQKLGYRSELEWGLLTGESRQVGYKFGEFISNLAVQRGCIVCGGETVVAVRGHGRGGRAQELALACAISMHPKAQGKKIALLSAGTDGIDGPTDAAGAYATTSTVTRARQLGLDPLEFLERNDAYTFFSHLGDLFKPGPTGVNVADLLIALINY